MIIESTNVTSDVISATFFTRDCSAGVVPDIVHRSSAPNRGSSRSIGSMFIVLVNRLVYI